MVSVCRVLLLQPLEPEVHPCLCRSSISCCCWQLVCRSYLVMGGFMFLLFRFLLFFWNWATNEDQNWQKGWFLPGRNLGQILARSIKGFQREGHFRFMAPGSLMFGFAPIFFGFVVVIVWSLWWHQLLEPLECSSCNSRIFWKWSVVVVVVVVVWAQNLKSLSLLISVTSDIRTKGND